MKFRTILADPPWRYPIYNPASSSSAPEHHYATMTTLAMEALPVASIAADDSTLLLWCTWPMLQDGLRLVNAWGFEYVSGLPWIKRDNAGKPRFGNGKHFRGCSEMILIGKRGVGSRRMNIKVPVGIIEAKRGRHSEKPAEQYDIGERYEGPRIELFSRLSRAGWVCLGNEIDGLDIRSALTALQDQPALEID
jgi:N6-adenosine-specific RNA methylase IME4